MINNLGITLAGFGVFLYLVVEAGLSIYYMIQFPPMF